MALIDLTQPYRDGMFSQKIFPPVHVSRCVRIEDSRINVTCLDVCVHHGTHVDAPRHFVAGGRTAADLRLEDLSGDAVGLTVRRKAGEAITVDDLRGQAVQAQPRDIVFIHTGWGDYFHSDPARYAEHPYLATETAEWLRRLQVKLVVLDVPTPDMPEPYRQPGFNWPVHHTLLEADILIAEHGARLELVAGRRFRAYAFPLPIENADGSPIRLVAEV